MRARIVADRGAAGSAAAAMRASRSTNCCSRLAAVFSPMPATPGSPSDASPRSTAKSAYWLGRTPYLPTTETSVSTSSLLMPRAV